ncbi:DUF4868 domain-containing protein [Marinilabiliaceae bacterium JC017]|nr:DUF4868 domain-containing protein [Marinilabiliaceae bacterium JC017]
MDKNELVAKVAFLEQVDKIAAKLYFHYNDGSGDILLEAPTNNESVDKKLSNNYSESVLSKFNANRDFKVLNIAKVQEFDTVATHYYYKENYPEDLQFLFNKSNKEYNFNDHDYKNIKGYLIDLTFGKESVLLYKYRHNYDIHIKPTLLTMIKVDNELTSPSHESIIINEKFDYAILGEFLVAISLSTLERKIKFDERVKKQSKEIIDSIKENGSEIVEGIDKLEEYLAENFEFAKKMKSIDFNGLLWISDFDSIKQKIQSRPKLNRIMRFKDNRFNITSKQAAKIFFKLCNDQVMESILSGDVTLVEGVELIEEEQSNNKTPAANILYN